jgi:5-methylcytosine-specific restriction endonuclease McrA
MAKWPYSTARWQHLRRQKLQQNPLCEACMQDGRVEPATDVDHRKPINAGGDPFPPLDGLASLCASCHNAKTRAEQLGETNWMYTGCDITGRPRDP